MGDIRLAYLIQGLVCAVFTGSCSQSTAEARSGQGIALGRLQKCLAKM